MTHIVELTQAVAHEVFDYDPVSGELYWKQEIPHKYFSKPYYAEMVNTRQAGTPAANINKSTGYKQVVFQGKLLQVHRVIWLMHTGKWPVEQLDHIDRVRTNNRLGNLREATHAQNMLNRSDNKSGHPNIFYREGRPKAWRVTRKHAGKTLTQRAFQSLPEAMHYRDATRALHGLPAIA